MTTKQNLSEKTTAALDNSIETLSAETQSKLQLARRQALDIHSAKRLKENRKKTNFWSLLPPKTLSAGFAFSVVAFLAVDLNQNNRSPNSALIASNSELGELILSNNFDETELDVIEDIEFAYWLSQELKETDSNDSLFDDASFNSAGQQHNG